MSFAAVELTDCGRRVVAAMLSRDGGVSDVIEVTASTPRPR